MSWLQMDYDDDDGGTYGEYDDCIPIGKHNFGSESKKMRSFC